MHQEAERHRHSSSLAGRRQNWRRRILLKYSALDEPYVRCLQRRTSEWPSCVEAPRHMSEPARHRSSPPASIGFELVRTRCTNCARRKRKVSLASSARPPMKTIGTSIVARCAQPHMSNKGRLDDKNEWGRFETNLSVYSTNYKNATRFSPQYPYTSTYYYVHYPYRYRFH